MTTLRPDQLPDTSESAAPGINLFLYQVTPNHAWNLADLLPRDLRPQILPYDGRLEEVFPGIQVDFAQRAMLHFVREVLPRAPGGAVSEHATRVEQILQAARPSPEPKDDPGSGPAP